MFYTGEGVFNFNGKDYKHGEELPTGIAPEALKSMAKKGKASAEKPVAARVATSDESTALRIELQGMKQAATEGKEEIDKLRGELQAATDALAQAQTTIEEMTKAQMAVGKAKP